MVSGVVGAGFTTTVLPASSAGASLVIMRMTGKFQGVIAATTPSGVRCWTMRSVAVSLSTFSGISMPAMTRVMPTAPPIS